MKNCFNCKYSKTFSLDLADSQELKKYNTNPQEFVELKTNSPHIKQRVGKCLAGFNDRMKEFCDVNGTKTTEMIEADRSLDMDCHDYHDSTKILISMNEKAKEMLFLLNKRNESVVDSNVDNTSQETQLDTAKHRESVINIAKNIGMKFDVSNTDPIL